MFTIPGTLLDVLGQGILIQGESGVGKSTLALELIYRGHQFIADDAVCFEKDHQQKISGSCPPETQDFMYIKEFGIINIQKMFGASALKLKTELKFVISLSKEAQTNLGCLSKSYETTSILGVDIPMLVMFSRHSSLPILVETIARNLILQSEGYFAGRAFIEQHQKFLQTNPIKSS